MFSQRVRCFVRITISIWALVLPSRVAHAQSPLLEPDDPSPATHHAQVIAQGVVAMPADEIVWRLTVEQAVSPSRADAQERRAGFILADKGVIGLVEREGRHLARIAPGEAIWNERGAARAVVSLERKAPDYYDIALVPTTELHEGSPGVIDSAPFVAPIGDAFDVDLIRDVLNRAEESTISSGPSPALLLITNGVVVMESTSSGRVEMTAGQAVQVSGEVVITGASRTPAAFVAARIGPEVPAPIGSQDATPHAIPAAIATPVIGDASASITLSAALCPVGYAGGNDVVDCALSATGVEFSLISDDRASTTAVANSDGAISFTMIDPGPYALRAEGGEEFTASRVHCREASGDDLTAHTTTHQLAMLLAAGDEVTCTWDLVPTDAQDEKPASETSPTPTIPAPEEVDADGDGLTDEVETELGTDPVLPDSDADGVSDSDEIDFYGTDALDPDTDDDGLGDADELLTYGANPLLADTDGDGISDGEEVTAGSDALDAASTPATPTPIPTATAEPTVEPSREPPLAPQRGITSLPTATPSPTRTGCDPAYPEQRTCIPPGPPLDPPCAITAERNFTVLPPDPRRLDRDGDGVGCEPISP